MCTYRQTFCTCIGKGERDYYYILLHAQLKDLKRQLHQMQKKEEKRQEQLADMTGVYILDSISASSNTVHTSSVSAGDQYSLPPHVSYDHQSSDNLSKHSRSAVASSTPALLLERYYKN